MNTFFEHDICFRTVFFNVFQNVIVVLYVFDNDTNPVIKISCFVGLAIECWKVTYYFSKLFSQDFHDLPRSKFCICFILR